MCVSINIVIYVHYNIMGKKLISWTLKYQQLKIIHVTIIVLYYLTKSVFLTLRKSYHA
jgi:glycopeptide antibiotics resistance protein